MQNVIQIQNISLDELKQIISETVLATINQLPNPQTATNPTDELIKIDEVCEMLKVSKVSIHSWKRQGILPFYRISNKIYFKKSEILDAFKRIGKKGA